MFARSVQTAIHQARGPRRPRLRSIDSSSLGSSFIPLWIRNPCEWQGHPKRATPSFLAFQRDLPTVCFDSPLHNGQAETRTTPFTRAGAINSVEALKHTRPVFRRYAGSLRSEERRVGKECRSGWWAYE